MLVSQVRCNVRAKERLVLVEPLSLPSRASAGELNVFSDEPSELNSVKWCVSTADAVLS
jgi:hypothetical protein